VLSHLGHHHPAEPRHLDRGSGFERKRDPIAELSRLELDALSVDENPRALLPAVEVDGHRNFERRIPLAEEVLRTLEAGLHAIAVLGKLDADSAFP
jgi:hypothetical protein